MAKYRHTMVAMTMDVIEAAQNLLEIGEDFDVEDPDVYDVLLENARALQVLNEEIVLLVEGES